MPLSTAQERLRMAWTSGSAAEPLPFGNTSLLVSSTRCTWLSRQCSSDRESIFSLASTCRSSATCARSTSLPRRPRTSSSRNTVELFDLLSHSGVGHVISSTRFEHGPCQENQEDKG